MAADGSGDRNSSRSEFGPNANGRKNLRRSWRLSSKRRQSGSSELSSSWHGGNDSTFFDLNRVVGGEMGLRSTGGWLVETMPPMAIPASAVVSNDGVRLPAVRAIDQR